MYIYIINVQRTFFLFYYVGMSVIKYQEYIDYLQRYKPRRERTIQNMKDAIKSTSLYEFDTANVNAVWKSLDSLLEGGASYVSIQKMVDLTTGALKAHGITLVKDFDYNILQGKLSQYGTVPEQYSEEKIKQILMATQNEDFNLFRICMLCTYSGLRIGGNQNVRYDAFEKHAEYGVYTYPVSSKGRQYTAAISQYAFDLINATNHLNSEFVVDYSDEYRSPFDKLYRAKLHYVLVRKHNIVSPSDKTVIFHSMRKFFATQIASSPLQSDDIGLLMGQVPKTVAFKHYILKDKKVVPADMSERIAIAYSMTPLAQLRLI